MADDIGSENQPQPARGPELLPAILAVALAVAAQLALRDGLTVLGVAGYIAAAWLFVSSVRANFDAPRDKPATAASTVGDAEPATAETAPAQPIEGAGQQAGRLSYLRRNWRLMTLAEIFTGDFPLARLGPEVDAAVLPAGADAGPDEPPPTAEAAAPPPAPAEETPAEETPGPAPAMAKMQSWPAGDSQVSSPRAVKVTPLGEVLVLDTGLGQVHRFDEGGDLLATYSIADLSGVTVLDLDVSPDGKTLYIVDAASSRLQVIKLEEVDPAGGAGRADEEE